MTNDYTGQVALYNSLYRQLKEGTIDEQRLNDFINNRTGIDSGKDQLLMLV